MAEFTRNVLSATLAGRDYACLLACGHTVICPGVHVRGSRFSQRAPFTAICNQCPKESTHG